MAKGHRSFAPGFLASLVLTLFVPIWLQVFKYNLVNFDSPEVQSTVIALVAILGVFYIVGLLLCVILRMGLSTASALNLLTYSLTPVNLAIWIVYGLNFRESGRLTIITFVLTGAGSVDSLFYGQLPLAAAFLFGWVLLVAYLAANNSADDRSAQSFTFTILLAPAMALSLWVGIFVGDMVRPGFINTVLRLFKLLP